MPSEIQPGRPGNLTAEQEAKLRGFWQVVLQVFGVQNSGVALPVEANGAPTPETPSASASAQASADEGKQKKSRVRGLFKRHDKDGDADPDGAVRSGGATTAALADVPATADNDKHGQTREFRQALASQTPEELRAAFWGMAKHDHPDGLLLRFLRARKWDVQAALVMLVATMHWRATEMHVDSDIMRRGEAGALEASRSADAAVRREGEDFLAQLRMGKSFLHGVDAEGRPMCFVRVRLHHGGEQSESSLERYTVYTIETARMLLRPPVDTAVSRGARRPCLVERG